MSEKQLHNVPCGMCHKPSGKTAKYSPYMSGDTVIEAYEEVLCDQCQHIIEAEREAFDGDTKDMEQVRRDWSEYRNEGLGSAG